MAGAAHSARHALAAFVLLACGPGACLAGPPWGAAACGSVPGRFGRLMPGCHAALFPAGVTGTLKTVNSPGRQGTFYLPDGYQERSLPAAVLLHGSTASGAAMVSAFQNLADAHRIIIIAPDSRDAFGWVPGMDNMHVARCLEEVQVLPGVRIDAARILVAGFSGARAAAAQC